MTYRGGKKRTHPKGGGREGTYTALKKERTWRNVKKWRKPDRKGGKVPCKRRQKRVKKKPRFEKN